MISAAVRDVAKPAPLLTDHLPAVAAEARSHPRIRNGVLFKDQGLKSEFSKDLKGAIPPFSPAAVPVLAGRLASVPENRRTPVRRSGPVVALGSTPPLSKHSHPQASASNAPLLGSGSYPRGRWACLFMFPNKNLSESFAAGVPGY